MTSVGLLMALRGYSDGLCKYADGVMTVQADLMLSGDTLETFLKRGDQGFEDPKRIFEAECSFNTGAFAGRAIAYV